MIKPKEAEELHSQKIWRKFDFPDIFRCLREYWTLYRRLEHVTNLIRTENHRRILDLGCGVISALNLLREDFPDRSLIGLDPLMRQYSHLYDLDPSICWVQGYSECLPFREDAFDLVMTSNTLDHVEELQRTVREIHRVLSDTGHLFVTMDIFSPHSAEHRDRGEAHPHTLSPADLRDLLESNGLKILHESISRDIPKGFSEYLRLRIREGWNRSLIRILINPYYRFQSWVKQALNRGALGESIVVAQKHDRAPRGH